MKDSSRIFWSVLGLLIAAVVASVKGVEGVVLRSLRVGQAQVAVVRRLEVEEVVPERGEDLDQAGMLEVGRNPLDLDLDLDHSLPVGHLGEGGHSPSGAHSLQEVVPDQEGNFLEHSLRADGLLVGLELIVNWEVEVDAAASGVGQGLGQDLDLDDWEEEDRWQDLGLAGRLVGAH